VQRYVREHPGDLIHIDVKKLARFRKVGHRITGNRQQGRSAGVGYDRVHVAIDDATRLAYFEELADGRAASHGHRLSVPCCGLVQQRGRGVPAGHVG
jgi:hypothetical protein